MTAELPPMARASFLAYLRPLFGVELKDVQGTSLALIKKCLVREVLSTRVMQSEDSVTSALERAVKKRAPDLDIASFRILSCIGRGNSSKVLHAEHVMTHQQVAVKRINVDASLVLSPEAEADVHSLMSHPNIVRCFGVYRDGASLCLVMEYCPRGDLFEAILSKVTYGEAEARVLLRQLLSALEYLHDRNVVHRDVKPENLLLAAPNVLKLADFGFAASMDDAAQGGLTEPCGTLGYVAPEVVRRLGYGTEVDLWGAGCVAYFMLCGVPPFHEEADSEIVALMQDHSCAVHFPPGAPVSNEARAFVLGLLEVDPKARISVSEGLVHEWLLLSKPMENSVSTPRRTLAYRDMLGERSPLDSLKRFEWSLAQRTVRHAAFQRTLSGDINPTPSGPRKRSVSG